MPQRQAAGLDDLATRSVDRLARVATPLVEGRWWAVRVGVFTSLVSLFLQAPALELRTVFFKTIVHQGNNLLTPLKVDAGSHEGKLAFRLVPPLLVHVTHMNARGYYAFQLLLGVVTVSALAWLFNEVGYSRRAALVLVGALVFTYAGAVWFIDTQPYFDAIAASALVLALCARQPALVFVAVSIAARTDERTLLPAIVVAIWHLHRAGRSRAIAVGVALVAYAALRLYLGHHYGLTTGRAEIGFAILRKYFSTTPLAIVLSLEGAWLLVVAGTGRAIVHRQWTGWVVAVCVAGSALMAAMVDDVTRSTVYLLPAVVMGATYLADENERVRNTVLAACVLLCVIVPTTGVIKAGFSIYYPFPLRVFL